MTKLKFILALLLNIILVSSSIAQSDTSDSEIGLEKIIENTKMRQSRITNDIEDAIFLSETLYKEKEKDGNLKKELMIKKRVYMGRDDRRHEEYLSIIRNGEKLDGKEFEEELKDWKKMAERQQQTRMPMTPEGKGGYEYYLIGDGIWENMDVWIVGFKAVKRKEGYINGKIHISKDSFGIVRMEFAPAKTSRVIKDMGMVLTYSEIDEYWMPVQFQLKMKIKVGFLVTLFYRDINVKEKYSKYKFNNQLEDSIFESD